MIHNFLLFLCLMFGVVGCGVGGGGGVELEEFGVELLGGGVGDSLQVRGLAADGRSMVVFRVTPNEGAVVERITVSGQGIWGRVVRSGDDPSSVMPGGVVDHRPVSDSLGSYCYELHSDLHLPEMLESDSLGLLSFEIVVEGGGSVELSRTVSVEVVRQPVVFVHGFNSSGATFAPMVDYLYGSGLFLRESLYSLDYSSSSRSSFESNLGVIPSALDYVLSGLYSRGIVCSRVGLVGHSMGGILSRLYLQGIDYRGDVGHLITICTPHYGSSLADLSMLFGGQLVLDFLGFGAIGDMRRFGSAISNLNSGVSVCDSVPVHVIATTLVSRDFWGVRVLDDAFSGVASVLGIGGGSVGDFLSNSDLIVGLESQLGGVPSAYSSCYDMDWHSSIHSSEGCMRRVLELLGDPAGCDFSFWRGGFSARN